MRRAVGQGWVHDVNGGKVSAAGRRQGALPWCAMHVLNTPTSRLGHMCCCDATAHVPDPH